MHGRAERRTVLSFLVIAGQLTTLVLARSSDSFWLVGIPWLASLGILVVLATGTELRLPRSLEMARSFDIWTIAGLSLLAGLLRLPRLESLPAGIYGDEGEFGVLAVAVAEGKGPAPFGVAFLGDPALYIYTLAPFVTWLGPTMEAIRLPSALVGTATVPLLYGLVRNLYGRFAAGIAAFLLATSAVHIHFSRLALNVIWVPFFSCIALWLLKRGLDQRLDGWFLLAGAAGGLGFYFHFGARLILPILVLILALQVVVERHLWRFWLRAMGLVAAGGVLALNPLLAYLSSNPDLLTAHTDKRGIWNHWARLAERYETVPADRAGILWEQFRGTSAAFLTSPDSRFGAQIYTFMDSPLLTRIIALLSLAGLVFICLRFRTTRARMLLVWFGVPFLLASVLTDVAGQAHRLVNPLLVALIAAALVVDGGWKFVRSRLSGSPANIAIVLVVLVPILTGFWDSYRYLQPGATDTFSVPATAQARCLEALPANTLALIAGAPRIHARHGPSRYLGSLIDRQDLTDASTQLPVDTGSQLAVILVHERNRALVEDIRVAYPDAPSVEIERPSGHRALTVFAITDDSGVAASLLEACEGNAGL